MAELVKRELTTHDEAVVALCGLGAFACFLVAMFGGVLLMKKVPEEGELRVREGVVEVSEPERTSKRRRSGWKVRLRGGMEMYWVDLPGRWDERAAQVERGVEAKTSVGKSVAMRVGPFSGQGRRVWELRSEGELVYSYAEHVEAARAARPWEWGITVGGAVGVVWCLWARRRRVVEAM